MVCYGAAFAMLIIILLWICAEEHLKSKYPRISHRTIKPSQHLPKVEEKSISQPAPRVENVPQEMATFTEVVVIHPDQ